MILLSVFKTALHSKLLMFGFPLVGTTLAVTESFLGNLVIAVVVAVIGATPPTIAIVLMSRKQSHEREVAHREVIENQTKIKDDLDGKLDRLSKAEISQASAEGKLEGAAHEQARTESAHPTPVIVANSKTNPVPTENQT